MFAMVAGEAVGTTGPSACARRRCAWCRRKTSGFTAAASAANLPYGSTRICGSVKRGAIHVAQDNLRVGDTPRLVEGRLKHHATERQLAGSEAAMPI